MRNIDRLPKMTPSSKPLAGLAVATGLALLMMFGAFLVLSGENGFIRLTAPRPTPAPAATSDPSPEPSRTKAEASLPPVATPAAPGDKDSLFDGDWVLQKYFITQNSEEKLSIEATVTNLGDTPETADLTVFAYTSGQPVGRVEGTVKKVGAGESVSVYLTGSDDWTGGPKRLVFKAKER